MNCRKARSCISAYYDHELSHSTEKELLQHLEHCTRCQKEKLYLEQVEANLRSSMQDRLGDDFNDRLFARIYSAPRTEAIQLSNIPSPLAYRFRTLAPLLAAACVLFIMGWVGLNQFVMPRESDQFATGEDNYLIRVNERSLERSGILQPAEPVDYFTSARGLAFSIAKLESLQVATALRDNRLMLNRLRLDAARSFGGFSTFFRELQPDSNDHYHDVPERYIYPVVKNAGERQNPY